MPWPLSLGVDGWTFFSSQINLSALSLAWVDFGWAWASSGLTITTLLETSVTILVQLSILYQNLSELDHWAYLDYFHLRVDGCSFFSSPINLPSYWLIRKPIESRKHFSVCYLNFNLIIYSKGFCTFTNRLLLLMKPKRFFPTQIMKALSAIKKACKYTTD